MAASLWRASQEVWQTGSSWHRCEARLRVPTLCPFTDTCLEDKLSAHAEKRGLVKTLVPRKVTPNFAVVPRLSMQGTCGVGVATVTPSSRRA